MESEAQKIERLEEEVAALRADLKRTDAMFHREQREHSSCLARLNDALLRETRARRILRNHAPMYSGGREFVAERLGTNCRPFIDDILEAWFDSPRAPLVDATEDELKFKLAEALLTLKNSTSLLSKATRERNDLRKESTSLHQALSDVRSCLSGKVPPLSAEEASSLFWAEQALDQCKVAYSPSF